MTGPFQNRPGAKMIEQVKIAYRYLLVMGIGMILFIFSIMVPILSSDADFSIYNTGWNGCSEIGKNVYETGSFLPTIDLTASSEEMVVHNSLSELPGGLDEVSSCIFIIGPGTDFDDDEGKFIDGFLNKGGLVLLADDIGSGNDLLSKLDTSTRITGRTMLDLAYMKNSSFSVTTEFSDHPINNDLTMLLMNHPSTVAPSNDARIIINSSKTAWLSLDGNDRWDDGEPLGPFPLLSIENYGRGTLIVLSEPSLLINNMNDDKRMDNGIFVRNLIEFMTDGRNTTIIDESHRDLTDPVQLSNNFISFMDRTEEKIAVLILISAIFIILNTSYPKRSLKSLRRIIEKILTEKTKVETSNKSLVDIVMERHPEWDKRMLEKIVKDIEGNS
jgi:hypothetical protein